MNAHLVFPRGPCPRRWRWLLALLLFLNVPAAPAGPPAPIPARATAPEVVTAWNWSQFYSPVESVLGNRRRMIQMLIVLMCVGLYIMMRKLVISDQ